MVTKHCIFGVKKILACSCAKMWEKCHLLHALFLLRCPTIGIPCLLVSGLPGTADAAPPVRVSSDADSNQPRPTSTHMRYAGFTDSKWHQIALSAWFNLFLTEACFTKSTCQNFQLPQIHWSTVVKSHPIITIHEFKALMSRNKSKEAVLIFS